MVWNGRDVLQVHLILIGASLTDSAFCRPFTSQYHPTEFKNASIPWVWEAVHDPVQELVDITVMIPRACSFNRTKWLEVSSQFPMYGVYFSYGNISSILVDVESSIDDSFVLELLGRQVQCMFYKNRLLVSIVLSLPVEARRPFMGPLLIRCPTRGIGAFDETQVDISPPPSSLVSGLARSEIVPVCRVPLYQPHNKLYNVSVITATNRDNPEQLIEWFEYHMLMGVDHFFVYNTALKSTLQQKSISRVLTYYVQRGVATEVLWPYRNCLMQGMARGRSTHFINALTGQDDAFKPPCPIAGYAAHASAYTRFRHTSRYILFIDDDEFVSLTNQLHSHEYHIGMVADMVFERHPHAPSLGLLPISMNACPVRDSLAAVTTAPVGLFPDRNASKVRAGGTVSASATAAVTLPRVFTKRYGRIGKNHEYKQLFRTDRVALFSVHYLSVLEHNTSATWTSEEPFFIQLQHGAILHYQTPSFESGDPFAHIDRYLPITNIPHVLDCFEAVDMKVGFSVLTPVGAGAYTQRVLNHLLPPDMLESLKEKYDGACKAVLI